MMLDRTDRTKHKNYEITIPNKFVVYYNQHCFIKHNLTTLVRNTDYKIFQAFQSRQCLHEQNCMSLKLES